ncbi:MAG: response regulator, partial [Cyclobacteriaceae bacterium]
NPEGKTILIVEDHKEVRALIKSILRVNFRIITAANGTEALNMLEQQTIDLILTDLMMPLMDGFELIEKLKADKELRKIPVIIISARNSLEEKVHMLDQGVEDVMSKPFDKDELIAIINNLLDKKNWDTNKNLRLDTAHLGQLEKEILKKVENLVLARIDDPNLSVMDLSNELAASERKVYRLIKRIAGITPYELIKEVRWQYVFKKLTDEHIETATEAAKLIGMSNPSDFSNQFEKRFGQPLSELLSKD